MDSEPQSRGDSLRHTQDHARREAREQPQHRSTERASDTSQEISTNRGEQHSEPRFEQAETIRFTHYFKMIHALFRHDSRITSNAFIRPRTPPASFRFVIIHETMCTRRIYAPQPAATSRHATNQACDAMRVARLSDEHTRPAPTTGEDYPFSTVYLPAEHRNHNAMLQEDPKDVVYA